jgi:TonB family protein
MTSDKQMQGGGNPGSRRRVPRFRMDGPVDITVVREGVRDTIPGRSVNVGERGIGAVAAGELSAGESVELEIHFSETSEPLRAKAMVRYQDQLRCGLEFVGITAEQRAAIREWAKKANPEMEVTLAPVGFNGGETGRPSRAASPAVRARGRGLRLGWIVGLVLIVIAGVVFWWEWNRGWEQIESGTKNSDGTSARVQVPTDVMQRLLVHQVQPVYPEEARRENLQGVIALDIVVAPDGAVVSTRALNGPDVLAQAATDALRWWKFQPYLVNGKPVTVETTMAVEFRE